MRTRRWTPLAAAVLGAAAAYLLVGGVPGLGAATVVAPVAYLALRRMEPAAERRLRARIVGDLPFAADLLAAALRTGAPVEHAVRAVGEATGGPVGTRLCHVAGALGAGAPPEQAWACLAAVPEAGRLVRAAVRSADSGAALAGTLGRLAEDLRSARAASADAAARRVGVLIVLPLGLCFLPAFILAGVAPVVVAVLGDVFH
jgi:Flp pilus assembly protein TadB